MALSAFIGLVVAMGSSGFMSECRGSNFHAFPSLRVFNAEYCCLRWTPNEFSKDLLGVHIILESSRMVRGYVGLIIVLVDSDFAKE